MLDVDEDYIDKYRRYVNGSLETLIQLRIPLVKRVLLKEILTEDPFKLKTIPEDRRSILACIYAVMTNPDTLELIPKKYRKSISNIANNKDITDNL